jgi:hypothetical protein
MRHRFFVWMGAPAVSVFLTPIAAQTPQKSTKAWLFLGGSHPEELSQAAR